MLGARLLGELGCTSWSEVKTRAQAASDEVFPRLFAVVASLADSTESASGTSAGSIAKSSAQGILRAAAFDLAMLAENLAERLRLRGTPFFLAKTGGMMGRCKFLETQLDERLRLAFPNAQIGDLPNSPAEAAARLALALLHPSDSIAGTASAEQREGH